MSLLVASWLGRGTELGFTFNFLPTILPESDPRSPIQASELDLKMLTKKKFLSVVGTYQIPACGPPNKLAFLGGFPPQAPRP